MRCAFYNKEMNVGQHVERNLIRLCGFRRSHQSNQGSLQSLKHLLAKVLVILGEVEEHFDSTKNNRGGSVLESVFEQIHNVKHFLLSRGCVL